MVSNALAATLAVTGLGFSSAPVAGALPEANGTASKPVVVKYKFANCTKMNLVYPHGVGRSSAKDHTSGKPVTSFKRSTSLYNKIIGYRRGLDRDKDGIACEKV